MPHTAHKALLKTLSEELSQVRSFVELLQQEQGLLMENSVDLLLELAEQKSAQAVRLNELTESRRQLMAIPATDHDSIRAWFETECKEGLPTWQEINTLAQQAALLNHINGELIQMKQRLVQQSLTALTRAVSQANLYGPDGQTSFSPGSGRSLGSV